MATIEQADDNAPTDPTTIDIPDGLNNLSAHNLLTYKSQQEALDAWALDELTSHYVNYRKLLLYRLFITHRLGLSAMTYNVDDFIRARPTNRSPPA